MNVAYENIPIRGKPVYRPPRANVANWVAPQWWRKWINPIVPPKPLSGNVSGSDAYRILHRYIDHPFTQDEDYTLVNWRTVSKTVIQGYIAWDPGFTDIYFDCDDHTWKAGGHIAKAVLRMFIEQLPKVAMGILHENELTAAMAIFYTWVDTPEGGHMLLSGIDENGLGMFEPQAPAAPVFVFPSDWSGYMCVG